MTSEETLLVEKLARVCLAVLSEWEKISPDLPIWMNANERREQHRNHDSVVALKKEIIDHVVRWRRERNENKIR